MVMRSINPVKSAREQLGFTIDQLAHLAGIGRLNIIRTEQGLYRAIPPTLANYLSSRTGIPDSIYSSDYSAWVDEKRRDGFGKLSSNFPPFNAEVHPFKDWREHSGLGKLEVCKVLCIHPSTLGHFESHLTMQSIPEQLIEALTTAGYGRNTIEDLSVRYNLYRDYQLAKNTKDRKRLDIACQNIQYYHRTLAEAL